ncbi:aminoglycoside phosphotransferase family protein [Porphyrobacter sp. AAP60]|uniref:aminoglycoside phosphotransferase family protein n=1 Tax=Porphyrobacter sp. AAP60 TaxID=1523423 RepID=UPI0006B9CBAF|nr:phosphotransferase [Porphyrobacter sp. AAP60]KPF65028.1 aminoglycoside phosphotransferase [Porphyrobacter sp. AAP60]
MSALPQGLADFVAHAGWEGAVIDPLPGDASFRRYFRLTRRAGESAMLMHAPPPHEDPKPFLHVAHWLNGNGMRGPAILAEDAAAGWVLTEDFGNDRMRDWLDLHPADEEAAYTAAIDALVALHQVPPGPFAPYDTATYLREVALFTDWYCPAMGLTVDEAGFASAWREVLEPLEPSGAISVTILRDYHAENIMLLGGKPHAPQGLIDFQDALVGHRAYDLVSLLQDARRDVPEPLEAAMLAHYCAAAGVEDEGFFGDYARLGAQRNAKIVGIFTRLDRRDGKPKYLDMIPRVWAAMERDLAHAALEPVARWFDANVPADLRAANGAYPA